METKGMRLKQLRLINDFTLDQVGDMIGVSKQTLYKYENDIVTNIPSDKIEGLAKVYHVTPSHIMGWEEDVNQPTTIAAHHQGDEWTEEELEDIEMFKELLRQKKMKKSGD